MTTAGTDDHPEVAEISAFTEGLLPPERTTEVRSHLDHCVLCADVRDSLAEIRGLLGTLPGPPRMPEEVARRIDAALAAEALIDATTPDSSATSTLDTAGNHAATSATGTSHGPRGVAAPAGTDAGGSHVSRETSPAPDRPAGRAGGASGPGRTSRGARRRWRVLTAATGVAVLGLGGLLAHELNTGASDGPSAAGTRTTAAGTFSGVALPAKVHELLGGTTPQARPNAATGGENSPFASRTPAVPACVLKATGHSGSAPVAASRGTYDGRTSYLVVLPHPSDPRAQVDAYVVDASCAAPGASSGAVGTVLAQHTYPRG
ncbi:anti-sigma factor family protein [Streptantibioticus silvisoli]|uniref:Zinc-finger domain-containing protein n=1 Tax=Streptantibioticus silvisoli TaxID=2705255 RepID=A0ABT6VV38_9ACTN|nr:hypothetical protein [Streptantibioticus silvisoli]MDI5961909.1 hypothetical protein [Streptantibioticus silvisoli]